MSFEIRGIHCDPSRRHISIDTMKKIIQKSSLCNINTLHIHLSDDQGIAVESNVLNYHGGWSICEQIKLAKYAKKYNIQIIPEIDIPGHTIALRSILENGVFKPEEQMGIISEGLIKLEHLAKILELYTEIADRFDVKYFHMGGDETKNASNKYFQEIVDKVCDWGCY
ncbi:hypothetical protein BMW23_0611 [Bodo saltans virus]|uniref:beta-N-acetylhexosaminidase n=1 Tax=Bodo saltans virus TaxID=2024608 RepID=A0A2H4UUW7_9VIRU|nr:hypothetical protein QJ851_gp0594 [Bodo saltans virus]ATZ80657.1 hypothetical protein BMW23_0611 [Bodo saltans virus]